MNFNYKCPRCQGTTTLLEDSGFIHANEYTKRTVTLLCGHCLITIDLTVTKYIDTLLDM